MERAANIAAVPVVFSSDLPGDLVRASMFVYITQSEGLGSAALLAMAMGVPVIASRVGGLAEVFEDGVSGLYVTNQPEEIAAAMRTVRENPGLAATLISGAQQRVKQMFSKELLVLNHNRFLTRGLLPAEFLPFYVCGAALFGLLIGSFLNVCVYRIPRDLSVATPRSFCPECGEESAWFDNVPLVSYVALRGKCRRCTQNIGIRYPLVEAFTAILFGLVAFRYGATPDAAKWFLWEAILVVLFWTDFEEQILPDELTLGGSVAGIVIAGFVPVSGMLVWSVFPALRLGLALVVGCRAGNRHPCASDVAARFYLRESPWPRGPRLRRYQTVAIDVLFPRFRAYTFRDYGRRRCGLNCRCGLVFIDAQKTCRNSFALWDFSLCGGWSYADNRAARIVIFRRRRRESLVYHRAL